MLPTPADSEMRKVGSGSLCSDGPSDAAEGAKAENHCSEAQSTDRMPAPSVVPFHPFKTQRGGKAGTLAKGELRFSPDTTPGRLLFTL